MLISLTSHNEPNPANFKNNFHNPITIQKNSYVCLVQGQIIRDRERKQVTIAPDTIVNIRIDGYNIFTLTLNAGGNAPIVFTEPALVTALNNAKPANNLLAYDLDFEFFLPEDEGHTFELRFFNIERNSDYATWIYGAAGATYYQQYWNLITGFPDTNPTSQNQSNRQAIPSVTTRWGLQSTWDNTYYVTPTNQVNRNAGQLFVSSNPLFQIDTQSVSQFQMSNSNLEITVAIGDADVSNANPPLLTDGPVVGLGKYATGQMKFVFQHTAGFFLYVLNNNTGTQDLLLNQSNYNVGDRFLIVPVINDDGPVSTDRLASLQVYQDNTSSMIFNYTGFMGAVANRPAGGNYLLSNNVTPPTDNTASNNMSYVYDDSVLQDEFEKALDPGESEISYNTFFNGNNNALWTGNTAMGCGIGVGRRGALSNNFLQQACGWIYDQSLGRPATFPFLNSGEVQIANAQIRHATGCWGFNTFSDATQRLTQQVEIPNVYQIFETPYQFNGNTLLMCHFILGDTTGMYPAGAVNPSHRVLFGSGQRSSIVINHSQTEAWDVSMNFERQADNLATGNEAFTLLDAAGARINFRLSTQAGTSYNYTFFLQFPGLNTYNVTVLEHQRTAGGAITNTTYTSGNRAMVAGFVRPASISHMGGSNPLDPFYIGGGGAAAYTYANMSPNTMFSNLRIYEKPIHGSDTVALWNARVNSLITAFESPFDNNTGLLPQPYPDANFFYAARRTQIFPANAQVPIRDYENTPYLNNQNTTTAVIYKNGVDGSQGYGEHRLGWYDIANINFSNNIKTPIFGGRNTTLSATSQNGIGQGIVEPTIWDTVIDMENPEIPDNDGNYLVNPGFQGEDGIQHPTARLDMDFDVLDIPSEKIKIQIPNLPHNSYNGFTKTPDKTIYEIPNQIHKTTENEQDIIEVEPPTKVWIPLNNSMEIPLNEFDVRIADVENNELTDLRNDTNVVIQIENDINLLN